MTERGAVEGLFAAARAGSVEAWTELYTLVRPQLFRFARARLATDEQAEDAVSETMARAIASQHRYRPGAGATAWMVGICRNVVFEAYRAGGRTWATDPVQLVRTGAASNEPAPDEATLAAEEHDELLRAFAQLGPDDQEVLSLRVVAGLDAEETGAVLDKRPGAVRMAQSRALGRLRRLVEGDS